MESDPAFVKEIEARAAQGDKVCKSAASCLQAMRSVICSNGCAGNTTAYFAATVAALQRHLQQKADVGASTDATSRALLLVLRKALVVVPPSVAGIHVGEVVAALSLVLKAPEKEDLVRQVLGCLAATADLAYKAGSRPNRKVLKPVFSFLGDPRPLVRHRAQLAATSVIRSSSTGSDQQTLDFATQHLAQMIACARPDKTLLDEIPARHAVTLLKVVSPLLPAENLSSVCMSLLSLPAQIGQHPVSIEAFEFLAGHLASDPGETAAAAGPTLAAELLQGLLGVSVSLLNVAYVVAYTRALAAAVAAMTTERARTAMPPQLVAQKLAALRRLFELFVERDPSLLRCLQEESLRIVGAAGAGGDLALLEELPEACRPLLRYECKGAWPNALPVIAGVFTAIGVVRARLSCAPADIVLWTSSRFEHARELIQELVQIRDKARSAELGVFGRELGRCLECAVTAFGPELMLSVAELRLLEHSLTDPGYEQLSRSWMLLVLKDGCKQTSLAIFSSKLLPLATALKGRATEAEQSSPVNAKKYATLLEQVWALLPALCDEALDLSEALLADGGRLAKQLVSVLLHEPQFRDYVWMAFARACEVVRKPPSPLSVTLCEANTNCLRTLSGRVMPEMFTTYIRLHTEGMSKDASRANSSRRLALETVQAYACIADAELVGGLFKNLVARLLKATAGTPPADAAAEATLSQAAPLADLANALMPHLPKELLELALKVFTPMLSGGVATSDEAKGLGVTLQKAAYRAICGVLRHPAASDDHQGSSEQVLEFWGVLRNARQTCEAAALKARLAAIEALLHLMRQRLGVQASLRQRYLDCLREILPEIMLHIRDSSANVREAARECLHTAATTAMNSELQAEVVTLLSAGLASLTPHSKASAVDALSRLLYEHACHMPTELRVRLVPVVLLLLEDQDAQVYRAALKFVKVIVYVVPKGEVEASLPQIMKLFKSRHMTSAKMLTRKIVERLAKLLPADTLSEAFPKAHLPLLHYVQRQLARRQRPQAVRGGEGSEDEEEEQEDVDTEMKQAGARESWASFRTADEKMEADAGADDDDDDDREEVGETATHRKRAKGNDARARGAAAEPATSAVAAHESVQALLDAWEAESGSEGEGRGGSGLHGKRKRDDSVAASTWIREDSEAPLDFMSADAAHSVLTVRPPPKRRRGEEVGNAGAANRTEALRRHGLRFAADGRLVVAEEEDIGAAGDKDEESKQAKKFTIGVDTKSLKPLSRLAALREARNKTRAEVRASRRAAHTIKGMDKFKPGKKRAQGDAKRPGQKLEPFAYIQLNPKVTKEKFKTKATQSFQRVVKGAKKGILKGLKAKARDEKLRKTKEARKRRRSGRPAKQSQLGRR